MDLGIEFAAAGPPDELPLIEQVLCDEEIAMRMQEYLNTTNYTVNTDDPDTREDHNVLVAELQHQHAIANRVADDNDDNPSEDDSSESSDMSDDSDSDVDHGAPVGGAAPNTNKQTPTEQAEAARDKLLATPCCTKNCIISFGTDSFVSSLSAMLDLSQYERAKALVQRLQVLIPRSANGDGDNATIGEAGVDGPLPKRQRAPQIRYLFRGSDMCRLFFIAVSGFSFGAHKKYLRIARKFDVAPTRENRGGARIHQRSDKVRVFLRFYADSNGRPNPSARGSREGQPVVFLDITATRTAIYKEYTLAAAAVNILKVSQNLFCKIWAADFPWLRIATKKTDFCNMCTTLTYGESENADLLRRHLERARATRIYIQACINLSGTALTAHLTFDYAQNMRLPWFFNQPKAAFFHAGAIVDFFAVADDALLKIWLFILAETQWPGGKDANSICSMLLHRLLHDTAMLSVKVLYLQADNCCGQNKNQFVFKFLAWLVVAAPRLQLQLERIEINFGIAGHTKNFCDAAFGLVKRKLKTTEAVTPAGVWEAVVLSTKSSNIPKCGSDVRWLNVKSFADAPTYFKNGLPVAVTSYQHFAFASESPGQIFSRKDSADQWQSAPLCDAAQLLRLKNDAHSLDAFDLLLPKAMSPSRKIQLDEIVACWKQPRISVEGMCSAAKPRL